MGRNEGPEVCATSRLCNELELETAWMSSAKLQKRWRKAEGIGAVQELNRYSGDRHK
jgi:hypothetical protein